MSDIRDMYRHISNPEKVCPELYQAVSRLQTRPYGSEDGQKLSSLLQDGEKRSHRAWRCGHRLQCRNHLEVFHDRLAEEDRRTLPQTSEGHHSKCEKHIPST